MNKFIVTLAFSILWSIPSAGAFSDIYDSEPLSEIAQYLQEEGIVDGYSDGTFGPLNLINRAEFMKMIVEGVTGETPNEDTYNECFQDIENEWFAKYVCYGEEQGWVEGYPDGDFKPGQSITRAEAVKIIVSAFDWEESVYDYTSFADIYAEDWYWNYIAIAEERGLFDAIDYYLSPHELISRKQFSFLLYRAILSDAGEGFDIWEIEGDGTETYEDWLASGLEPAYPSDMTFPANSQSGWTYGCYSFAVKNIIEWKYNEILDIAEVQEEIKWDGEFIWNYDEMTNFTESYNYDIIMTYQSSPEYFLKKLAMGEPVVLYIPYYVGINNIGHQLVAYSFDQYGVWVADSLSGGIRRQIGWDEVFVDDQNYTTNVVQIRKLTAGGQYVYQLGL